LIDNVITPTSLRFRLVHFVTLSMQPTYSWSLSLILYKATATESSVFSISVYVTISRLIFCLLYVGPSCVTVVAYRPKVILGLLVGQYVRRLQKTAKIYGFTTDERKRKLHNCEWRAFVDQV